MTNLRWHRNSCGDYLYQSEDVSASISDFEGYWTWSVDVVGGPSAHGRELQLEEAMDAATEIIESCRCTG